MSAEKFAKVATGARNLAFAAAIAAGIAVAVYLFRKAKQGVEVAKEGAGFLLGTSNESSLGSSAFDFFGGDPDYKQAPGHEQQELNTCRAIYRNKGYVVSDRCKELIDKYGP